MLLLAFFEQFVLAVFCNDKSKRTIPSAVYVQLPVKWVAGLLLFNYYIQNWKKVEFKI